MKGGWLLNPILNKFIFLKDYFWAANIRSILDAKLLKHVLPLIIW